MLGRFAGYEISGVVGCGGMGIVLKGLDPARNRYAAIKVLAPHYASNAATQPRGSDSPEKLRPRRPLFMIT
jgi:eukaryotic-like serine/threonine-protein kinase